MIQDIYPHKFDNHFISGKQPCTEDTLFIFSGDKLLCRIEEECAFFPLTKEFPAANNFIYLFSIDEKPFFMGFAQDLTLPDGYEFHTIRDLRKNAFSDRPLIFAAITAYHLNDWYRSSRFCGCCGHETKPAQSERAVTCPSCKKTFYPRINPAVIVGVINGENLLLTKYAGRSLPYYALVAGFTEIGESLEETVRREVMEEVGLSVKNIRYYKSQPWGFAQDILAGFFCEADGCAEIHMDKNELKEAIWMPRADIPGQSDDFSLTNEMMMAFKNGLIS